MTTCDTCHIHSYNQILVLSGQVIKTIYFKKSLWGGVHTCMRASISCMNCDAYEKTHQLHISNSLSFRDGLVIQCFCFWLKSTQVELKEYIKIRDTIYEVDSKAENGFTFSRLLNFKVKSQFLRTKIEKTLIDMFTVLS